MFAELLRAKLAGTCQPSEAQIERLLAHYELLVRWNQVLNLTSVRSIEDAVERHYCESVFAACHLPAEPVLIADIGSGAGFPGIPIAIMRPLCSMVLIESHQRKAAFLKEAARSIANVRVAAKRAADVRESFDWVVSRAVRYSEIAADLKRLGRNAELLTGEVGISDLAGFRWREPVRLPWGERRYLRLGTNLSDCFT
ncbi:MAG: 16S rRNA (guanine(527)-N(7))-methyltransferase RsmG [Bryobacteraceae bacterium]|jgi:16S rRNA (guanine527-N7)-methyltransferase